MNEALKLVLNLIAVLVLCALAVFKLKMERVTVPSNAMAPTLTYGDEVLVWKGAQADRTDVMVCDEPDEPGKRVFGRVAAFAGERISVDHNGSLYINNHRTASGGDGVVDFIDDPNNEHHLLNRGHVEYFARYDHPFLIAPGRRLELATYAVPEGLYLLGENWSLNGYDSRAFGAVDAESCLGQVVLRWKPGPPTGDDLGHGRLDIIE